jgi:hypothetical protein
MHTIRAQYCEYYNIAGSKIDNKDFNEMLSFSETFGIGGFGEYENHYLVKIEENRITTSCVSGELF